MALETSSSNPSWNPDSIATLDLDDALPESLLILTTTKAGEVEGDEPFIRVPFVGADPAAAVVAEGASITPADATPDEVAFQTQAVKVLSKISNELARQPGATSRILKSLQRSVRSKADAEFVAALATASTGFVDGGTFTAGTTANLDTFSDSIADVEANGGEASHVIMPASAWKAVSKLKTATGSNLPILGVGDASADGVKRSIFGLQVLLNATATAIYVVSKADLVSAYSPLRVAVSEDFYFGDDSLGLRADLRFGVAPARPNRQAVITLA